MSTEKWIKKVLKKPGNIDVSKYQLSKKDPPFNGQAFYFFDSGLPSSDFGLLY
jgi:hypothetical protein